MIDRSVAWVSQVERGMRKVDRMSVLETLAAALDVPLAELAAEAPVVAAVSEEPPGASGLRLVLSGAYALRAMLSGRQPPALSTLRSKSRKAWELTHAGRYADLTDLLRGLIPDLETAARTMSENQRAEVFELMAATYQACSAALAKLGEPEAAWIAADRAMAAAERACNPILVAAGASSTPSSGSTVPPDLARHRLPGQHRPAHRCHRPGHRRRPPRDSDRRGPPGADPGLGA